VELVVNGDLFNYLQVFPDQGWPQALTEQTSLELTDAIVDGHVQVFDALARFAATPHHKITFLIGNHDLGLFWPSVQQKLTALLGEAMCVHLQPVYRRDGCWIEHGNQFSIENRVDFEMPIVEGNDGPVVNMPWLYPYLVRFLGRAKRHRSYINRVRPYRSYLTWALRNDTSFFLRASGVFLAQLLRALTRGGQQGKDGRRQLMHIAKEYAPPVRLEQAMKRIFALQPEMQIVIFGHGHRAFAKQLPGGRQYFNTGLWNETIDLGEAQTGRSTRLSYVEIAFNRHGAPHGRLLEWSAKP